MLTRFTPEEIEKRGDPKTEIAENTFCLPIHKDKDLPRRSDGEVSAWLARNGYTGKLLFGDIHGQSGISDGMYLAPAKAANLKGEINLSVNTDAESTKVATDTFKKYFNNEIAAVNLGQKGSYGMDVRIAVKVDLSKLNTENLNFFAYDRESNTYVKLTEPKYQIDANGYLHFDTSVGGDVIITDQALTAK